MKMKFFAVLTVVILAAFSQDAKQAPAEDMLKISVLFEADCPDCVDFFRDQLIEAWEGPLSEPFPSDLVLLPYGNAQQRFEGGRWNFTCQHGPEECLHNKLHACAIQQACGDDVTSGCERSKLDQVIRYILCVIQAPDQVAATAQCTSGLSDLTSAYISGCATSEEGDRLLNLNGNLTNTIAPGHGYVPYVLINGKHDVAAEDDLVERILELRPPSMKSCANKQTC